MIRPDLSVACEFFLVHDPAQLQVWLSPALVCEQLLLIQSEKGFNNVIEVDIQSKRDDSYLIFFRILRRSTSVKLYFISWKKVSKNMKKKKTFTDKIIHYDLHKSAHPAPMHASTKIFNSESHRIYSPNLVT